MSAAPAGDGVPAAPERDEDVAGFAAALGLPGLIDVHTHFMPRRVLDKVWAHFDTAAPVLGRAWPIVYRGSEEERLATLRALGVRAFTALVYPHKPDMAQWLNAWAADFARRTPDCLHTATFYPEPAATRYVEEALAAGAQVFKAHLQVGRYDPRDPLLTPAWAALAATGTPVVTHCGSGPVPGAFTGPGPIGEVLARHPALVLIVAHLGMPEYAEFADLALRWPDVRLDTTLAFTELIERGQPCPPALRPSLVELREKILFGSDFPNIPHPYAHQVAALARLDLGADWLRAVLYGNAATLFDLAPGGADRLPGTAEPAAGLE